MGRGMTGALVLIAALGSGPVLAADAGSFDGNWNVLVLCPTTPEGLVGHTSQFSATVTAGALHGQQGTAGQPGAMSLDGTIAPDGTAKFAAKGRTGQIAYTNVPSGSPYGYEVTAKFQGARGKGDRVGAGRACGYTFTRQ